MEKGGNHVTTKPLSHFPVPTLAELPEDIRTQIVAMEERTGFIPNILLVLAYRPAEFRAFMAYHDALMDKASGLSKAEREMIVVTTSAANQCEYCVIAHGAILRVRSKQPLLADQLAINYRHADITERQRAMLDFALKVCREPEHFEGGDIATLQAHGFSDDDIWDIGAIAALFALSNRMAFLTGMWPNTEFYMLGRSPVDAPAKAPRSRKTPKKTTGTKRKTQP
jgi:uncharacterized peroxidase-related enzyme